MTIAEIRALKVVPRVVSEHHGLNRSQKRFETFPYMREQPNKKQFHLNKAQVIALLCK